MSQNGTNGAGTSEAGEPEAGKASDEAVADLSSEPRQAATASSPEQDRLADLVRERDDYKDRFLRSAADFENYRKRVRREVEDSARSAKEAMLRDFLPIIDNLERAMSAVQGPLQAGTTSPEVSGLAKGVELVLKLFNDTLSRFGVRGFQSKGNPFDPQLHEAIQQVETGGHPPGTVIEEFQKGYMLNNRLVRPAMVVVAKAPEGASDGHDQGDDAPGPNGSAGPSSAA